MHLNKEASITMKNSFQENNFLMYFNVNLRIKLDKIMLDFLIQFLGSIEIQHTEKVQN